MVEKFASKDDPAHIIEDLSDVYNGSIGVSYVMRRACRLAHEWAVPGVTIVMVRQADSVANNFVETVVKHTRDKTMEALRFPIPDEDILYQLMIHSLLGKPTPAIAIGVPENDEGIRTIQFTATKIPGLAVESVFFKDKREEHAVVGKNPFYEFKIK